MIKYKYIFNAKDIDSFKYCPHCGSEIIEVYTGDYTGSIMCSNDNCEGLEFEITPQHYLYIQRKDNLVFEVDRKKKQQIKKWDKHRNDYHGAIGGHLSYTFTPTSIGDFLTVTCHTSKRTLGLNHNI